MNRDIALILGLLVALLVGGVGLFVFMGEEDATPTLEQAETDDSSQGTGGVRREAANPELGASDGGNSASSGSDETGESNTSAEPEAPEGEGEAIFGIVVDEEGRGVPDALLTLADDVSDFIGQPTLGLALSTVKSGPDGTFRLMDLDQDTPYLIRVDHESFATTFTARIDLNPKEQRRLQLIMKAGRELSGVVQDASGSPLEGVEILAFDQLRRGREPDQNIERVAKSGADGSFRLAHLNLGYKRVVARKAGYETASDFSVQLRQDEVPRELSFTLGAGEAIAGRLVDEAGNGVPGVIMTAAPSQRAPGAPGISYPSVKSDETGAFRYDGLARGEYRLLFFKRGFAAIDVMSSYRSGDENIVIRMRSNPVLRGRVVDAADGSPVTKFGLTLSRGGGDHAVFSGRRSMQRFEHENGEFEFRTDIITGKVNLFASAPGFAGGKSATIDLADRSSHAAIDVEIGCGATLRGRVQDSSGVGIEGATVELLPQFGGGAPNPFVDLMQNRVRKPKQRATTDAEGLYVFEGVAQGLLRVRAKHPEFASEESQEAREVGTSGEVQMPDLQLRRGGRVEGTVFAEDGQPAANSLVRLILKGRLGTSGMSARSDAKGRFSISAVPAGVYFVQLVEREGKPAFDMFSNQGRAMPEIQVREGELSSLDLGK